MNCKKYVGYNLYLAKCLIALSATLLVAAAGVNAAEVHQHGAHVHGIGTLNVALDGQELYVELDTPAANIVGFEHEPKNDEQASQLHEALELLGTAEKIFIFPVAAKCISHEIKVNGEEMADHHGETEHHHEEGETGHHHVEEGAGHHHEEGEAKTEMEHGDHAGHSEISASYQFKCENPQELKSIGVQLFAHFPGFEKIEVQLLTPKNQTAVTLTPDRANISF